MQYRVRKRWHLLGSAIVAVLGCAVFFYCFREIDHEGYEQVLERANPALSGDSGPRWRATQMKKGIQKVFWQNRDGQHLESVLTSSEAELVYEKEEEKAAIVENMKGVRCVMQEELFYLSPEGSKVDRLPEDLQGFKPFQTVREVEAETAKYHYTSDTLDAFQVSMRQYQLPGHQLPDSFSGYEPVSEGRAEKVAIFLIKGDLKFHADRFKGTLMRDK